MIMNSTGCITRYSVFVLVCNVYEHKRAVLALDWQLATLVIGSNLQCLEPYISFKLYKAMAFFKPLLPLQHLEIF
jgi:hypothetical protein